MIKYIFLFLMFFSATFMNGEQNNYPQKTKHKDSLFKTRKGQVQYFKAYNETLKLWKIPFEEEDVKTSFGMAHVIISGEKNAPVMILLHGMNASSTMWYPNVKAFSEKYRVYAIDLIWEPGKSIPGETIKNNEDMRKWYNEIFDHFGLKKINLVGASRGGWMAMDLALHTDGRIEKIVLLSPAEALTTIKIKRSVLYTIFTAMFPKKKRIRKSLATLSFDVNKIAPAFINQYIVGAKKSKKNISILQMTTFSDDELKSFKVPVLLLIGDHDIINNEKSLERAKNLIPNIKTEIIENAGHFLSFDQPEIIDHKVLTFLGNH